MALDVITRLGQFVLYLGLGYFFLVVVLAVSGEPVNAWPLRRRDGSAKQMSPGEHQEAIGAGSAAKHHEVDRTSSAQDVAPTRRVSSERHLEFLDRLKTNLKYQGSTIALIVFAVLVLGLQHVLDGPLIGTLLGGITGYVLGTSRGGSDANAGGPGAGHEASGGVASTPKQ